MILSIKRVNYVLSILIILFIAQNSNAQGISPAITNAAGNTNMRNGVIYEWSIGEMALVETMSNTRASITNGLLQSLMINSLFNESLIINVTNILSPNGDGINDTWIIEEIEKYPENEVTVFDRSGRVVFQSKNYKNTWDGRLSGLPLAENTYYYTIKLKMGTRSIIRKGYITIVN